MGRLIERLAEGPLDVIGDIHGELEALEALLEKLGYDDQGRHTKGRRLVFVGDLCDRGPDSPGVIRLVQSIVESGCGQAVAGNHELNLLRREKKHGNHWFYGESANREFGDCVAIAESEQTPILAFFRSLPIGLERSDLRIVHAAWIESAIEQCRMIDRPVDAAFEVFETAMHASKAFRTLEAQYAAEVRRLGNALKDGTSVPAATEIGPYDEFCQMGNPVRVITSGVERATRTPFFASGKWRYVDRVAWWRDYTRQIPVLFGHYWRWWDPSVHGMLSKGEPQLFSDDPIGPFMAQQNQAFCVDFSVGSRFKQRPRSGEEPFHGRLAAMRWPERELVFDAESPRSPPLQKMEPP